MNKIIKLSILLLAASLSAHAKGYHPNASDSTKKRKQPTLSLEINTGMILPTNDFIINSQSKPTFSTAALRYGFASDGTRWSDVAYGMPYGGIGLMVSEFFDQKSLGNPLTLYAYQGTTVANFSRKVKLNFEWKLGASFNWEPYDPFDNPDNIALGSSSNVFVGLSLYANFHLSKSWDLAYGFAVSHFSNGASRLPNKGLNLVSSLLELKYNFNRTPNAAPNTELHPPKVEPRIDYDFLVNISTRQQRFDTLGTNLPSEYVDKNFSVYGFTFAPMLVKSYKYKYGVGFDLLYDESSGAKAWREVNPADNKLYERIKLGPFKDRISLGISVKGELVMPMYSIFANFGYNIIHGNAKDKRLYQVVGVKAYLKENLFGTFGIRASNFSKAQYLYWSLGYTLKGRPIYQIKKDIPKVISRLH